MISELLNQLDQIKKDFENNSISEDEAKRKLQNIITQYNLSKDAEINKWSSNFFEFLNLPETITHLKQLYHTYLGTNDADDKKDRNQKLFLMNQIEELMLILNKA